MQTPAPLTVLGLVALATTAIVCGDTAGKLLTGAGVQPLFVAWCRVALNSGHPQFVCHGLTEFHRLKGSGRGIEEALGSNRQRGGW